MDESSTLQQLLQLSTAHRVDGDGGYALVQAIRDWATSLNSTDREHLWGVLIELVIRQDVALWGVALEVLVQEHRDEAAIRLADSVNRTDRSEQWKDQVVLALLRLGYKPSVVDCETHIRAGLASGRRAVLPLLAALCHVDSEVCLNMAASYFGRAFQSDDVTELYRGYIPAFVRNFIEVDERLLQGLVEQIRKGASAAAAKKMATLIDDCLARPMFAREIGTAKVTALRKAIGST